MSSALQHPFTEPPSPGHRLEVARAVYWLHFPLPFALDHINLWLLEDGEGWTVVDTGFGSRATRDLWRVVFDNALGDRPLTAFDLLPVLFKRKLDSHQLMFAMGESIAHLNCLHATGRVSREERDGRLYHVAI